MADTRTLELDPILAAIDAVISACHGREMHAFHALHDAEGHAWAGEVDQLRFIRDLVVRLPFAPSTP